MNKHLINIGATQHTIHMPKMTQVRNMHLNVHACMHVNIFVSIYILTAVPGLNMEKQEAATIAILVDMIEGLKRSMKLLTERMDRLEVAVFESQCSHTSTKDVPPPLPPRNTPKLHPTPQQHPVTHDVSLSIPPGYLIPVKLTDF